MLKFLSAKGAQHPLNDAKTLEAALKALPGDSTRALEEIGTMLEELRATPGLAGTTLAETVEQIDAAAQVHARRVAREYLAARGNRAQSQRLLGVLRLFWGRDCEALTAPLDQHIAGVKGAEGVKKLAPILLPRALRAWASFAKWQGVDYTPLEPQAWARITALYALAERMKLTTQTVQPYPKVPAETTVQREFVALVAFVASSPDALDPHKMEILERLVVHLAPHFDLTDQPDLSAQFALDLGAPVPPTRIAAGFQPVGNVRLFGSSRAMKEVENLIGQIMVGGTVPEGVVVGENVDPTDVTQILQHLLDVWGSNAAMRRHQRRKMEVRLTVAYGFDGLIDVLVSLPSIGTMLDFSSESPVETWVTEEVGFGGFEALAPNLREERLAIGSLIAMQAEGAPGWQVGIVRRLARRPDGRVLVGVETLARAPIPTEVYVETNGTLSRVPEVAILLTNPIGATELSILVRAGASGAGQVYVCEHESADFALEPRQLVAHGSDYELLLCAARGRETAH